MSDDGIGGAVVTELSGGWPPPWEPRPVRERDSAGRSALRDAMARFGTGITVLTTGGENTHGMTANAFSSVSLEPPMVLCCVARTAEMHEAIVSSRCFAVNVLGGRQERLARHFADRRRPRGPAQFEGVDWWPGKHTGAPLFADSLAWLECRLVEVHDGGDHSIFLGEVLEADWSSDTEALLFLGGSFHQVGWDGR
ncbi:flavin reductase family protein [Kitasatospora sp. GP82]|uniref:flavin reductase family protein n=1 Tax=Kitasatospora sp. GP82 TaxID=3035089 RepID=UPI0024760B40|nr:flavin reductase family protein [Kitasatospora sp. GP82]MDH6124902.1 flavin reductase (DIM6/NTAB) family NADH-FMN oxidoreductase RutF [Kitasatospora sp. GP82]